MVDASPPPPLPEIEVASCVRTLRRKMLYTQQIYTDLRTQFPHLTDTSQEVSWEEMWKCYDQLTSPKLSEKDLMPYHLLQGLNKGSFYMPPDTFWSNPFNNSYSDYRTE